MVNGILIKNTGSEASVNSGNPVWLNGATNITFPWKREVRTAANNSGVLSKVDQANSLYAPIYTIQGFIRMDITSGTFTINGQSSCSKARPLFLNQLLQLTHSANTQLSMSAFWGDYPVPNVTGGTNGCNVVVSDVDWDLKADSQGTGGELNPHWDYTIILREVTPL